jgi:hypothetical protein
MFSLALRGDVLPVADFWATAQPAPRKATLYYGRQTENTQTRI